MIYRRIRKSDEVQLTELCRTDSHWTKYYSKGHGKWLERALKEVFVSKDRVVFGAFDALPDEGDVISSKLIACIFLKLSEFEFSVELKNLMLPAGKRVEELATITGKLIEKVIRFSEVRNIHKIEIELPQDEHHILSIFLERNFRIIANRNRYMSGTPVCILERKVGDRYYGDPFDSLKFSEWLLRQYLPCESVVPSVERHLVKLSFESKTISQAFSRENNVGNKKRLRGVMWILEHSEELNDELFEKRLLGIIESSKGEVLKLLYVDYLSEEDVEYLKIENFVVFDYEDAKIIAGGDLSSMSIPIFLDEIGGAITVLEQERILQYFDNITTTYYLFSGVNSGLDLFRADSNSHSDCLDDSEISEDLDCSLPTLAVYCPNWNNQAGVIGIWEIQKLVSKKFDQILESKIPDDSALSRDDLLAYKVYSENEWVTQVSCGELYLFEKPLSLSNNSWVDSIEMKNYLSKELSDVGNNAAYLDRRSCERLKNLQTQILCLDPKKKTQKPILHMIAEIIEALSVLSNLTAITDFSQKQIEKWKADLTKDNEDDQGSNEKSIFERLGAAHATALRQLTLDYEAILTDQYAPEYQKKKYCKQVASKAADLLNQMRPFKTKISDYDDLLIFFNSIVQSD